MVIGNHNNRKNKNNKLWVKKENNRFFAVLFFSSEGAGQIAQILLAGIDKLFLNK
jgi:hypothetical protein